MIDYLTAVIVSLLLLINIVSLIILARDKGKSRLGTNDRTPEGLIFFLATIFGSVGVALGMVLFRHKTKKWYFVIGIPLLMVQNLATLYLLFYLLPKSLYL